MFLILFGKLANSNKIQTKLFRFVTQIFVLLIKIMTLQEHTYLFIQTINDKLWQD